jgi:hypothetical protein
MAATAASATSATTATEIAGRWRTAITVTGGGKYRHLAADSYPMTLWTRRIIVVPGAD